MSLETVLVLVETALVEIHLVETPLGETMSVLLENILSKLTSVFW